MCLRIRYTDIIKKHIGEKKFAIMPSRAKCTAELKAAKGPFRKLSTTTLAVDVEGPTGLDSSNVLPTSNAEIIKDEHNGATTSPSSSPSCHIKSDNV